MTFSGLTGFFVFDFRVLRVDYVAVVLLGFGGTLRFAASRLRA